MPRPLDVNDDQRFRLGNSNGFELLVLFEGIRIENKKVGSIRPDEFGSPGPRLEGGKVKG